MLSDDFLESLSFCTLKGYYTIYPPKAKINSVAILHRQIKRQLISSIKRNWIEHRRDNDIHEPVFFTPNKSASKEERQFFSYKTQLQSKDRNISTDFYKIVNISGKSSKHKISTTKKIVDISVEFKDKPEQIISKHCAICEFQNQCSVNNKTKDDLRLFSGMKHSEIKKWNELGFFTVTQLSYKFRPRKKSYERNQKYLFELKALAIREQKTIIRHIPEINKNKTEIFIDFESLPDEQWIYLIGVVIVYENISNKVFSFWANDISEERTIFEKLFDLVSQYQNSPIYHYGNYEKKELFKFNKKNNQQYQGQIEKIEPRLVNILKFFYSDIYPPTYSNSLKDISNYIGFNWTNTESSGLISILWRKKWELWKHKKYKNKLIRYNIEDCLALMHVKDWIQKIESLKDEILKINNIPNNTHLKFGKTNYVLENYNKINSAGYFNYQRTKIYIRTNKAVKKHQKLKFRKSPVHYNTTKTPDRPKHCPKCNYNEVYIHQKYQRALIDLKFSSNGVKRWVTDFRSHRYRCKGCNHVFTDSEFYRQPKYGNNIGIWIVNNYLKYGISYGNLKKMLKENFNIDLTRTHISKQKKIFANRYQKVSEQILSNILKGPIIHIDETTAKVKSEKCYVWVLTNMTNVYYIFRPNRETKFLEEYLNRYEGVLISDYYTGYDSFACNQQKCLIHLLRDINDLVFKNPNHTDLISIAQLFGDLMNGIICTIDKYGLKKRNLNKHKKDTDRFYKKLDQLNIITEVAIKLKKRLKKNRHILFLFLEYNGVPWNNNNAEHAIKAFAKYRRNADGIYNKTGLEEFLTLLSISETCSLQGKSFLGFLKGEISIE